MNILYAAPMRLPTEKAHGIQIMETCAALAKAGAHVELAVTRLRTDDPFSTYGIPRGLFTIQKLPSLETIRFGRLGFWVHALVYTIHVVRRAKEVAPDVIYTRDPLCALVTVLFSRVPTVWEVHSEHRRMPHVVLRHVWAIISITKGLAETFVRRGVPLERIVISPDAVSLEKFENAIQGQDKKALRERFDLRPARPTALYTGSFRIYSWKGVDVIEKAAALAPEIDWVLAGGAPEECDEIRRAAPPNLFVLSRVGRDEIPHLLLTADILLLPNKKGSAASERDTSPMKLFEYMAMRIPIVASDLPSLREVLNEQNAFFAEPNSAEDLVRAVREAVADTDASERKAKQARLDIEKYTWDTRARTILCAIESAILNHRI